ncbi:hypothetical protein [Salipaludibacillus keqinensis]|nr:hypothetical protein [Salipaludibacillus keqinensis]
MKNHLGIVVVFIVRPEERIRIRSSGVNAPNRIDPSTFEDNAMEHC